MRHGRACGVGLLVLMWAAAPVWAQADDRGEVAVALQDGSVLVGAILEEDAAEVRMRTSTGLELRVPRSTIVSIRPAAERRFQGGDLNRSRLLFAPTGRPLEKGEGYFSDHYVFFPGFTAGITDHFSLGAGMSVFPLVGLSDQVFYVAPRLAWNLSEKASVSTGMLYARAGGYQAGVAFGIGTFGTRKASVTFGLGLVANKDDETEIEFDEVSGDVRFRSPRWELRKAPVVMVGGSRRLSERVALISENWLFLGEDFDLSRQPFGLGLRFSGDRISVDVGVIVVGEVVREGLPVPWLSFTYRFLRPGAPSGSATKWGKHRR